MAIQFVTTFITLPRNTTLLAVSAMSTQLAAALNVITSLQWEALQVYLTTLIPTYGKMVFSALLSGGGGGLVVTKTIDQWLYGYVDPLMLLAAQTSNPATYQLTPYSYMPSLALAFPNETYASDYFGNVTGQPMEPSQLSWNSSGGWGGCGGG